MQMKTRGSWKYAVIGLAVICLALPASLFAQQAPAKVFKQEELDQLLAPIALYPDDLLTQILMASTYPLEVVQAERWAKQNKSLKGDALKAALEKQTWDDSVKALVPFPDVLTMMSEKLEWTQKLGDAFLAQQKDVMDTVQKLRRKANEAGNLKSSKEQEVKKEGDIIIVEAANPQVVYVPAYNPTVVYGAWRVPGLSALSGLCLPAGRRVVHVHDGCRHRRGLVWAWVPRRLSRGKRQYRQERQHQQVGQAGDETLPAGAGEGARASNGSTTRSTGKGFPTGTRGHATSIPRQTVRPWTTVRVTVVTTSRRQAQSDRSAGKQPSAGHPIALAAVSRHRCRTERPIDRVPGQRVRTTPSAGRTAAGDKRSGTAREAARACPRQSPMAAAGASRPSGGGASRGGGGRGRR